MKKAEQVLPYSIDEETEDEKQEVFIWSHAASWWQH